MYSFYLHKSKAGHGEYTSVLLRELLSEYLVDNPNDATHVLVSLCDITEIGEIKKAKKLGKPIITGGFISETPILNELSDYVWHGEAFAFADYLDQGATLEEMPHITTRNNRKLNVSTFIDWGRGPIVNVGKNASYFYTSKGCKYRCKFCLMSHSRPQDQIGYDLYRSAEQKVKNAKRNFMPIGAYDPYRRPADKRRITEIMLKSYLRESHQALKNMTLIRCGVEFMDPDNSKRLAKNVQLEDLNRAIEQARRYKHRMILYFLLGLESRDTMDAFIDGLIPGFQRTPDVRFVFTQIDPQPGTPMYDLNIEDKHEIDAKRLYWRLSGVNKRFSSLATNYHKATLRTLLQRVITVEDYNLISKKNTHEAMMTLASRLDSRLLGTASLDEVKDRKRSRDYTGLTAIPYWQL